MEQDLFSLAQAIVERTDRHLFLTGRAGTGKTTFLRRVKERGVKRMVVLAPTGIAAINAGGSTIHSFLQLKFGPFVPDGKMPEFSFNVKKRKLRLIQSLDLIVIDEISMVRADLLDQVDAALRFFRRSSEPFGGVQMVMIGDLQQLPPVAKDAEWQLLAPHYRTPYFFSAKVLEKVEYATIELTHVYRQKDERFLSLLGAIREGRADATVLAALNERCQPDFTPPAGEGYIRLVTHNIQADRINAERLEALPGAEQTYKAKVSGTFPESAYPAESLLALKPGAQVMFIKNNHQRGYYNGMLAEVLECDASRILVQPVEAEFGETLEVEAENWDNTRYTLNERTGEMEETVEGTFLQIPLRLAWAITIHKSQGLTFDRAMIDVADAFTHGQTYVALSRCRTLEGMVLTRPLPPHAIIKDAVVGAYQDAVGAHAPLPSQVEAWQKDYALKELTRLFLFRSDSARAGSYLRVMEEHLYRQYPKSIAAFKHEIELFNKEVSHVGEVFVTQLGNILHTGTERLGGELLQERIRKAVQYFQPRLRTFAQTVEDVSLPCDNADVEKRLLTAKREAILRLALSRALLRHLGREGFLLEKFLPLRASLLVQIDTLSEGKPDAIRRFIAVRCEGEMPEEKTGKHLEKTERHLEKTGKHLEKTGKHLEKTERHSVDAGDAESDILHPEVFDALRKWRLETAAREKCPPFIVAGNRALIGISNALPTTRRELSRIKGVGEKFLERYADECLEVLAQCRKR